MRTSVDFKTINTALKINWMNNIRFGKCLFFSNKMKYDQTKQKFYERCSIELWFNSLDAYMSE